MGLCLDTEDCRFQNRDKARFCARCGIPTWGTLLQGRYEVQDLVGKGRNTITLRATDRREGHPVIVRALLPVKASAEEREIFLQDAELAVALSSHINEAGSIRVTDYGQDGPIAFLVKSELEELSAPYNSKPGITARVGSDIFQPAQTPYDADSENEMLTELQSAIPKASNNTFNSSPMEVPDQVFMQQNWLAEGDRAYELRDYEDALAAYEATLVHNNTSVEAWSGKGATLLHLGHTEEALIAYDQALFLHPNDPDLWNSRANVLHEL